MPLDLGMTAFDIIGPAGEARSIIFETLDNLNAKKITTKEAMKRIEKSDELLVEAGKNHMSVVSDEASGKELKFSAVFMHAEDIFLTTQTMSELVKRLIPLFEKLENIK